MANIELTVPCQWDLNEIKKIISNNSKQKVKIAEMYGALSDGNTPQGRTLSGAHQSSKENALCIKRYLEENHIKFAYLINTPLDMNNYHDLENELEWIINVFRADSITISSLDLMKFIRTKYPTVHINVSTIAGIKNVNDIQKYIQIRPAKIIAHHDLNRDFAELQTVVEYLRTCNIKLEVMVNESCLRRCPYRDEHYKSLGEGRDDKQYHLKCNTIKFMNPYQLLMANFIRPEDLTYYEDMGIYMFKVTGRSKPKEWLPEVITAYADREYSGNLIRLLGIDPILVAESKIFISNKALDDFILGYPKMSEVRREIAYCEEWIAKLYRTDNFRIEEKLNAKLYFDNQKLRIALNGEIY